MDSEVVEIDAIVEGDRDNSDVGFVGGESSRDTNK